MELRFTSKEEAMKGNKVWMVGKYHNTNKTLKDVRSTTKEEAKRTNNVFMVGKIPNKRDLGLIVDEPVVENVEVIEKIEDTVEVPSFMMKYQEQRRMERLAYQITIQNKRKPKQKSKKITIARCLSKIFK